MTETRQKQNPKPAIATRKDQAGKAANHNPRRRPLPQPVDRKTIFAKTFATTLGHAALVWRGDVIKAVFLPEKKFAVIEGRCRQAGAALAGKVAIPDRIAAAIKQIINYFAGEEHSFKKIKLDMTDIPAFRQLVYKELQKIGPGCTVSYGELGEACGKNSAARAIGGAVGANPFPLLIPCHRVINADGSLGGFSAGAGLDLKAQMLRLEGIRVSKEPPMRILPPETFGDIDIAGAIKHLSAADADLGRFIKVAPAFNLQCDTQASPFMALLESIVYQQLTGKAAATIFARLLNLFSNRDNLSPLDIIRAEDDELKSAGLSGSKIAAIRDLAEFAADGRLPDHKALQQMSDSEIISRLTSIRGIGRWTVEMLLIFKLGRPDVMAADDYGLRKGLAVIRNTPESLPDPQTLARQARSWQPFRSIAAWYLWRASEMAKAKPA